MDFSFPSGLLLAAIGKITPQAVTCNTKRLSYHLRESICEFQLGFSNYLYSCAERHKEFKNALSENVSENKIRKAYSELDNEAVNGFSRVAGKCFSFMTGYFNISRPSKTESARISIHIYNYETSQITRLFPIDTVNTPVTRSISDVTGFRYVDENGTPYLCNHTPKEVLRNHDYHYNALDIAGIRKEYRLCRFKDSMVISRLRRNIFKREWRDKEWGRLMNPKQTPSFQYFKSHLIIPITFTKHLNHGQLEPSLIQLLNLQEDRRSILGYIVIDHPGTYYFDNNRDENIDVNVMYIYADMISMMILVLKNFTECSESVRGFKEKYGDDRRDQKE